MSYIVIIILFFSGHYFDYLQFRPFQCFLRDIQCNCQVCTEGWSILKYRDKILNLEEVQTVMSAAVNLNELTPEASVFKNYCDCFHKIQDLQGTLEHHQFYKGFRKFTDLFQFLYTDNYTLNCKRTPKR